MPTRGATIQNIGSCSTSAPKERRILLVLPFCKANPNCIPRKPKLMVTICAMESNGFGDIPLFGGAEIVALVDIDNLSADNKTIWHYRALFDHDYAFLYRV